jgi:hypothetical protein
MISSSAHFSGWFRLKDKTHKDFNDNASTKLCFWNFHLGGRSLAAYPLPSWVRPCLKVNLSLILYCSGSCRKECFNMSPMLQSTTHYGCYVGQYLPAMQNGIWTRKYVLCERFMKWKLLSCWNYSTGSVRMGLTKQTTVSWLVEAFWEQ